MDFRHSERSQALQQQVQQFLDEHVYPGRARVRAQAAEQPRRRVIRSARRACSPLEGDARAARAVEPLPARRDEYGAGLSVLDYAPIAELSGRSVAIAPEAMNCSAPDTGNMELLAMFASDEQVAQWLKPLLDGEIRSCFSMTEPAVASSDATNIATTITRDGDDFIVNGRKWWSTGALRPECKVAIVMGVSDPEASRHARHSMILVPLDTPGVHIERSTTVYGYDDGPHGGHGVIHYDHVRVPSTNLLGPQGGGFMMAQARLGPGRIHHCMRSLGMAERALELMCARVVSRTAFGKPIAEQGVVREWIAESQAGDRPGPAARAERGLADRHGRREERPHRDRIDQGGGAACRALRRGEGGAGARCGRGLRRHAAGRDVGAAAHAAAGRRPGRSASALLAREELRKLS